MTRPKASTARLWAASVALALASSGPAHAGDASPAPSDAPAHVLEAERLGERAFEAYASQQYAEAVALYERAYATAPNADALYNIARVYDIGLRDRRRAIQAYRRFLTDPGAAAEPIRLAAERARDLLRAEVAELESRAPALAPPPRVAARVARPAEPADSLPPLRVGALVAGAVGVASLAAGGALGLSVLSKARVANASCVDNRCTTRAAVDAAESAGTRATLATVGVSLGAALLATGATLWIVGADSTPERDAPPGVRVTPLASRRELGVALAGGW